MNKNRILHCPSDVGGQAWELSRAEKKIGYRSCNINFRKSIFKYNSDYNFEIKNKYAGLFKRTIFLLKVINKYDIFHFYFGKSILPLYLDLPILKIFRKKIFFTFQGCDIRRSSYCISNYNINACKECSFLNNKRRCWNLIKFLKLKIISLMSNKTFVLNPDLKDISKSSVMLPYANVDLDSWLPVEFNNYSNITTILHAPTNQNIKGTKHVINAISMLRKEGYSIKFNLIENVEHNQMKKLSKDADIVIDQLLVGYYGGFAVEMMAMQKPVICYLNKNLFSYMYWSNEIPIVNANHITLYEKIKWLIDNPQKRKEIGILSRKFVEKHHNPIKVAQSVIDMYNKY